MNGQTPPNSENYTIPGAIKLFFDQGQGEEDFGNIVDTALSPKTDDLEHYSNRSGKRRKDKVFALEEALTIKAKLDEPVFATLQKYFKGGPVVLVGAGTANAVDQKAILTGEILSSLGQYGISAVTVRQFLDACYRYDGVAQAFVDLSAEMDTLGGVSAELLVNASDYLYLLKDTKFKEFYVDLDTLGVYTGLAWQYWDGSAWQTLAVGGAGAGLDADGKCTLTPPADWAKTAVNGKTSYPIRAKATAVTTPATCKCIRQNGVLFTEYIVDPGQATGGDMLVGRVGRLAAGFLFDGEEVKVSFTYITWTSRRFPIATTAYKQGRARLECYPEEGRGVQFNIVLPLCQLKPDGDLSLDDKKVMEVPIALEVLDNSKADPDYPYGWVEYPD